MSIFHPTPTSLATAIHTTLTRACAPHPSHSYKTALFATTITAADPVLTCLHRLSTSTHITPSERHLFTTTHTRLSFLLAQEAAGVPISNTQLLLNALLVDDLVAVLDADLRASGQMPLSEPLSPLELDTDPVEVLLHATATALRRACDTSRGGVLRTCISGAKQLLVALEGLSRDGRLAEEERAVFARARDELHRLWALQRQGDKVRDLHEAEALYIAYRAWWRPVLGVLQRDRERRAGGAGERVDGQTVFAAALASGEWIVREGGAVDGGSAPLKRASATGSLAASFRRKVKGVFT
ncbi:hypothetical protein MMC26_005569 [Xylographa opegraphella]|nr:hypothetical protein [Xylographa opegraphella]